MRVEGVPERGGEFRPPAHRVAAQPRRFRQRAPDQGGAVEATEVAGGLAVAGQRPAGAAGFGDVLQPEPDAVGPLLDAVAARRGEPGRQPLQEPRAVEERLPLPAELVAGIGPVGDGPGGRGRRGTQELEYERPGPLGAPLARRAGEAVQEAAAQGGADAAPERRGAPACDGRRRAAQRPAHRRFERGAIEFREVAARVHSAPPRGIPAWSLPTVLSLHPSPALSSGRRLQTWAAARPSWRGRRPHRAPKHDGARCASALSHRRRPLRCRRSFSTGWLVSETARWTGDCSRPIVVVDRASGQWDTIVPARGQRMDDLCGRHQLGVQRLSLLLIRDQQDVIEHGAILRLLGPRGNPSTPH